MTTVHNIELTPDQTPIQGVVVSIRTSVPAATADSTGTVVPAVEVTSGVDGSWSVDLIPNASGLVPKGVAYIVTRKYPKRFGMQPVEVAIMVPPSTTPVNFDTTIWSTPTATPLTDSELTLLTSAADPLPQYLTTAKADARYMQSDGTAAAPTPQPHTFITDFDDAVGTHQLDDFASPSGPVHFGGQKASNLADGTDVADAATLGQVEGLLATRPIMTGGSRIYLQDATPTGARLTGDLWISFTAVLKIWNGTAWATNT